MPKKTWSAHWIKNQEFRSVINNFLDKETELINSVKENLEQFAPYKSLY